jgi:hypothetical protein
MASSSRRTAPLPGPRGRDAQPPSVFFAAGAGAGAGTGFAGSVDGGFAGTAEASVFFDDPYRSAYQPPPLSWNVVREIWRDSSGLPHAGQLAGAGSEIRCITSTRWPQLPQAYS